MRVEDRPVLTTRMTHLIKKIKKGSLTSNGSRSPSEADAVPRSPPSPTFDHLTNDELKVLNDVIKRQEEFEAEEARYIIRLQEELDEYENRICQHSFGKNKLKQIDLRLCRLCFKTKFADGIGRVCYDCHRRVCNKCGLYSLPRYDPKKKKYVKGRWQCNLCLKRRELACASGMWFHGKEASPTLNGEVFLSKLNDVAIGAQSDFGAGADYEFSEGSGIDANPKTDTELSHWMDGSHSGSPRSVKRSYRRRTSQSLRYCNDEDDLDDEQFFLERQRCRRERIEMQKKTGKRRNSVHKMVKDAECQSGTFEIERLHEQELMKRRMSLYESHRQDDMIIVHKPKRRESTGRKLTDFSSNNHYPHLSTQVKGVREAIRRTSSDGQPCKKWLLRSDILNSHSSDSAVWLESHPHGLLNPHLSTHQKENLSSNDHVKRKMSTLSYQYGSNNSVFIIEDVPNPQAQWHDPVALVFKEPRPRRSHSQSSREDFINESRRSHQSSLAKRQRDSFGSSTQSPRDLCVSPNHSPKADRRHTIAGHTNRRHSHHSSAKIMRVTLHKDNKDPSCRTSGFGMRVVGGRQGNDGQLAAVVAYVAKGGPADRVGIHEGDQILEWDNCILENATFEEVRQSMSKSGDTIQLIVKREMIKRTRKSSDAVSEDGKRVPQWHQQSEVRCAIGPASAELPKRQLPQVPIAIEIEKADAQKINGRVNVKLWQDVKGSKLTVNLIQAIDLPTRDGPEKEKPHAFVKLYLLPHRKDSKVFKTQVIKTKSDPEWKESFIYENIGPKQIENKSLEITIWDFYARKPNVFLGEILLDLKTANLQDQPVWYQLEDHDENSSPLPEPSPKEMRKLLPTDLDPDSQYCRQSWKSMPALAPAMPTHDKVKEMLIKKNVSFKIPAQKVKSTQIISSIKKPVLTKSVSLSPGHERNKSKSLGTLKEEGVNLEKFATGSPGKRRGSRIAKVKRCVSSAMLKVSTKLTDRRAKSLETNSLLAVPKASPDDRRHSDGSTLIEKNKLGDQGLIEAGLLSPWNASSSVSSGSAVISVCGETTNSEMEDYSHAKHDRPSPEGDDITSMLGPGQIPPRPKLEKLVHGDIMIGIFVTKGQLEVDVVCVRGLTFNSHCQPPDTYVKIYLMASNKKRIQKKKTKTAKCSVNPFYRQKIKFYACNAYGRYMQIQVKEKMRSFEPNHCLGEVIIKLDNLDLTSNIMGSYKLFEKSATDFGSAESLF